jgi:hypothetical protein
MCEAIDLFARSGRNDVASDLSRILAAVDFEDLEILRCPGSDMIADEILRAESFAEFLDVMGRLAATLGVAHCTLHVIREAPSTNFSTKVLTTYPGAWVSRYLERRYFFVDPIGRACLADEHGFFWDSLACSSPTLEAFWNDAAAHGIGPSGFSLPITTERGDKLAVSVCSAEPSEAFRDRIEGFEGDLFSLSIFLADTFSRLASIDRPATFDPTDDQLTILRSISIGIDEADLRARTYQSGSFDALEQSICTLFRTRTLAQAAILASRIGLLAEAPWTKADILAASVGESVCNLVPAPPPASMRRLVRLRHSVPIDR